ncbi:bifunctional diguanylate cyclase/phosphodiesterase [Pleionea sediminis]|uniref:bifunctional diguanylate cyclase/phosphodiesterase n=1 Tax=Pleionea sediminis TaxID=2569479 RepID=UPI001186919C|nr:EAL domain-containing protein [Pleionea sediminis]
MQKNQKFEGTRKNDEQGRQKSNNEDTVQHALLQIASLSSQVKNLSDFYKDLHEIVNTLMSANNFYIALKTDDRSHIRFVYFCDEAEDESFDPTQWPPEPIEEFKKTLSGYIIRTSEALLADYNALQSLISHDEISMRGEPPAHWMGVPLKVIDETIGVMVIQTYKQELELTEHDKELLIFVSQHIASVLEHKQYEEQLRSYNERLEIKVAQRTAMLEKINQDLEKEIEERERNEALQAALFKISELSNTSHNLDEFYSELHHTINQVMPSKNFYICTYKKSEQKVSFPYIVDEYDSQAQSRVLDENKPENEYSPTEWVLKKGEPLLINKSNIEHWKKRNVIVGTTPTTWLGVPLIQKSKVRGVLAVQSYLKGKSYTQLDKEILMFVAHHVSTAIYRKKNADSLKYAHDELKKVNDQLEKRVAERTQELSITNSTLKKMLDERNKMQKKLAFEAFHDSLTGLPNRALFTDRLNQIIQQRLRNREISFTVLFLDLDRFKVINDSLGHIMGDKLLQEVAGRLEDCIRPNDTVARLGGDEFCVLLRDINMPRDAAIIADRIIASISTPFQLDEHKIFTSTSIGIAICTDDYSSPEDVLRDADAAMYHAKASGKARYSMFDNDMYSTAMKRLRIESDLRHALEKQQIKVFYQPIIELETGRIVSFEALARWIHDDMGFIPPDEFIPIAEETGMIHEIGSYVLNQSLRTLKHWQSRSQSANDISVSVNFSSKQIEHHDLLEEIKQALDDNKLSSKHLKVEITESLLIRSAQLAQKLLKSLSEINIEVLLDDFGTGYSSLSYLHKFTLHTIKIDRSFIDKMDTSKEHLTIVKAIAFMCQDLNLGLIAEGIESKKHIDILKSHGIRHAQGYHFSKPVPADEAAELIKEFNSKTNN